MDKEQQINQIKTVMEGVYHLRTLPYKNGEFAGWKDKVGKLLEATFGKESLELYRFNNAPGKAFVVGTELGREQEYQRQLDCYESALKSITGIPQTY